METGAMLLGHTQDGPVYVFDRPPRILIVDDDPILREFALSQLAQPGAVLAAAADGDEGWEMLTGAAEPFDLVLSDLEMPRVNGFELLERIRAEPRFAGLPVVVITSREDVFAIDRAYELGATSFVTKPVNWRLLGYQLRYVLRAARLENDLRLARDEAARTAALRRSLLALLQHETRTPLHAIVGYSEILRAALLEPATLKEAVEQVLGAARALGSTLDRVFTFSQLASGTLLMDREIVRLAHVIEEAARPAAGRARRGDVRFDLAVEDREAWVTCDLRLLTTALDEVLANALAHAPAESAVRVTLAADDDLLSVSVSDEGPGMSPEALGWCAEPFAQEASPLTRAREGLGLGLPTAQRIVELHGGTLTIACPPTGGTIVTLSLPRAQAAPLALTG